MRIAGRVLMDRDQAGHAAAALIFAAHRVAGALGCDHDDVDVLGRLDQAEMDVQAMREGEGGTRLHPARDIVVVDRRLMLVGRKDHQYVGPFGGLGIGHHLEASALSLLARGRAFAERDRDVVHPAVAQVLGMGVALAAIADDRDFAVLDQLARQRC